MHGIRHIFIALPVLLSWGCASTFNAPELREVYEDSAQHRSPDRNPVILIPGMMGSQLVDTETDQILWGAYERSQINLNSRDGIRKAALPMESGARLQDLRDDIRATQVLDRLHVPVLGTPVELRAYTSLMASMGLGGFQNRELAAAGAVDYGDEHYTCFQFPYDWRRDMTESARHLHEYLLETKAFVAQQNLERFGQTGKPIRFDIVAHSAGALLLRYYLRYGDAPLPEDGSLPKLTWAAAELVETAILVAPPNAGSAEAMMRLVDGYRWAPLFTPSIPPAVIGTMPSAYQLLPRERHQSLVSTVDGTRKQRDPLDKELWVEMGWGLADPGQDEILEILLPNVPDSETRREIALNHLDKSLKRARQFHTAIDRPAKPPEGLDLHLIAGDGKRTPAVLEIDPRNEKLTVSSYRAGDGLVPRSSALMDERVNADWQPTLVSPIEWTSTQFLDSTHLRMTRTRSFTNNLLYLLLEAPR